MSKFNVGDKVRYIGKDHDDMPKFYPPVGTIGTVIKQLNEYDVVYVQWEKGSTSKEDCWYCNNNDIELVKNEDMTNEEIWEMLRPKMEKNGLEIAGYLQDYTGEVGCYDEDDVHNAIALAYCSGYIRAIKGRPFKIGEKKKKGGHWEPVDPNNLPKYGTKVKYSRYNGMYKENFGREGEFVAYGRLENGMTFSTPESCFNWMCFDKIEDCLDMWVEDDE